MHRWALTSRQRCEGSCYAHGMAVDGVHPVSWELWASFLAYRHLCSGAHGSAASLWSPAGLAHPPESVSSSLTLSVSLGHITIFRGSLRSCSVPPLLPLVHRPPSPGWPDFCAPLLVNQSLRQECQVLVPTGLCLSFSPGEVS